MLTVRLHPRCNERAVWEGRVLDHTGHAVVVLQVGGEAEGAVQSGGAVRVKSVVHFDGEKVIWRWKVVDQPADLRLGLAADG